MKQYERIKKSKKMLQYWGSQRWPHLFLNKGLLTEQYIFKDTRCGRNFSKLLTVIISMGVDAKTKESISTSVFLHCFKLFLSLGFAKWTYVNFEKFQGISIWGENMQLISIC